MPRRKILWLCILAVTAVVLVWSFIQDLRDFLFEHRGIEYYQRNPIMIVACIAIAVAVGLTAHFILEWRKRKRQP